MPRRLLASTVALLVLLLLTGAVYVARHTLGGWMTPLGLVAPLDLVAVAVSMMIGGAIARSGFRGIATALVVAIGVASAVSAWAYAPSRQSGVAAWLLHNTLLQLVLSAAIAWAAAHVGQRIATRTVR